MAIAKNSSVKKKKKSYNAKYRPACVYIGAGSIQLTFKKESYEQELFETLHTIAKTTKRSLSFVIRRVLEKRYNLNGTELLAAVERTSAKASVGTARLVKDLLIEEIEASKDIQSICKDIKGFDI